MNANPRRLYSVELGLCVCVCVCSRVFDLFTCLLGFVVWVNFATYRSTVFFPRALTCSFVVLPEVLFLFLFFFNVMKILGFVCPPSFSCALNWGLVDCSCLKNVSICVGSLALMCTSMDLGAAPTADRYRAGPDQNFDKPQCFLVCVCFFLSKRATMNPKNKIMFLI